ncbi:MAG: dTMP kinase [Myxococcales bacterium]
MFVVFEGIDGCGKTTISNRVVERLKAQGYRVKHLRAEGRFASTVSESIRELSRDSQNLALDPRAEFLLYVARDVQLMEESLLPALEDHDIVIADRFLYTAEVLARFGRHLPPDYVTPVVNAAAAGLAPELVVLVDLDPSLARARRKSSKLVSKGGRTPSRKGLSGVGLSQRLRAGYRELAAESPERWFTVHNDAPLEEVVVEVTTLIDAGARLGASTALREAQARRTQPRAAPPLSSPEQARDAFLHWIQLRAEREPQVAAYMLAGLFGGTVDDLRLALARHAPQVVLAGLAGLTNPLSWQLREELALLHPAQVARGLTGPAALHPQGQALQAALFERAPGEVLKGLAQRDSELAWALRERAREEHAEAVLFSLSGLACERSWRLRDSLLAQHRKDLRTHYGLARAAAKSVQGLSDERAWALRESTRAAAPLACVGSLAHLSSARSFELRASYLRYAPKTVMESLRRLDVPEAWQMRRAVAADVKEALDGMVGVEAEAAWALRTEFADQWPSTAVKSLGSLADTPRGQEFVARRLALHGDNVSLLKHATAIALGLHRGWEGEG